jgi:archaellum component FlaF (FlaF/FlaG flagellin family)
MDEYSQKVLYALANEPGSTLNMIYASPAAYTVSGRFKAKTEAEIAKAFKGVNIYVEMPETYSNLNEDDKKAYKKVYNNMWTSIDNKNAMTWSKEKKKENLLNDMKQYLTADEYKEFKTSLDNIPANVEKSFWAPGNSASFCANFAVGKKLNYQNNQTKLTPIPVSLDGYTLDPTAKQQLQFMPYVVGTGKEAEKGFQINMEFDATGTTMKNVSDPNLMKGREAWNNESQRLYQIGRGNLNQENSNKRALIKPQIVNK